MVWQPVHIEMSGLAASGFPVGAAGCCAEANEAAAQTAAAARKRVVFIDATTPARFRIVGTGRPAIGHLVPLRRAAPSPDRHSPARIGADSTGAARGDQLFRCVKAAAYTRSVTARPS